MDLLIASRQSDLARLQAYQVGDRLKALGHNIQYHFRQSLGDINQEDPLWKMPEKGVFTEDFREGLEKGEWDMVVHSWKDLPIDPLPNTELVATLQRADARDVLILKKDHLEKVRAQKKLRVYSSSPRRIYNLTPFLKNSLPCLLESVEFESVRGNILTRVKKLFENEQIDGLIVAKAAIDRLLMVERDEFTEGKIELKSYLAKSLFQVLPLSRNPTAAAQGALAIEIKKGREDLKKVLSEIHCQKTWNNADFERKVLKSHGGGCHQKIGVTQIHGEFGDWSFLRGETESGQVLLETTLSEKIDPLEAPCLKPFNLFDRKSVEFNKPTRSDAHFIARSSALPDGTKLPEDHVIWVSGIKTWFKLAERGYWVSGCSDSLGEHFQGPGEFFGSRKWAKWTHTKGHVADSQEGVFSYELAPKSETEDLSSYKEFYWMSGSQFERAIQLFPEIINARHFCGPGHTYTKIQEVLKSHKTQSTVIALPGRDHWLNLKKD